MTAIETVIAPENKPFSDAESAPKIATISPDILADEIAAGMSEATAKEDLTKEYANNSLRQDGEKFFDKSGTAFDPEKHRANPLTGTPELNGEGNFKSKRGRKSAEESYRPKIDPISGAAVAPDEYDQQADFWLGSSYALLSAAISPAWKPGGCVDPKLTPEQQKDEAKAEHEGIRYPLAAFLREKRFKELKPWQMLTLASIAFGFKRYQNDETTQKKFDSVTEKVRLRIFGNKNDPSISS